MSHQPQARVGALDVVAFLCELAMLTLLVLAGAESTESLLWRVVAAIALPVVAAAIWSVWMAPTSRRRLRNPIRLYAQLALFAVTGAVAGTFLGWPVGAVFFLVSALVFGELCRRELRTP
ncbi:YrdB family protein [Rhodococcus sp. NPDC059234]|uniref:YrdB family protein n=1 Tax=Rhodococcus sp. NPDC059234 TaxID=3346781 RepID=UPI003670432C